MKSSKKALRETFLAIRKSLSKKRREEGEKEAFAYLSRRVSQSPFVLSFASYREELNLWPLNKALANEGRLVLPKVLFETKIVPYHVRDVEGDLISHPKWRILEPNPKRCQKVPLTHIDVVIVPGIAFDVERQRLGYGKGLYDRFLTSLCCPFIGVGFKEQFLKDPFFHESHDVPLSELVFF